MAHRKKELEIHPNRTNDSIYFYMSPLIMIRTLCHYPSPRQWESDVLFDIASSNILKSLEVFSSENKWKVAFISSFLVTSNLYNRFFLESDGYYALELAKIQAASFPFISDIGYTILCSSLALKLG